MLTIYGVPISVHVRKVRVVAGLKGLDFTLDPVFPFTPPEGWAELSPTGLIPAMADDGFRLADSTAISLYLEQRHPTPAALPTDPQDYARSLWFDAYAGGTLFRHVVHGLFFEKVLRKMVRGEAADQTKVDEILATTAPTSFRYLESQAGDGFLAGETLSLGDIAIASNLINYLYLGLPLDADRYPRLTAYLRRVLDQPAMQAALAAEAPAVAQMGLDRSFLG